MTGSAQAPRRSLGLLTAAYAAAIVYGSLYPLAGWRRPSGGFLHALAHSWPDHISRTDVAANFLLYLPLGLLLALALRPRLASRSVFMATALAASLSAALESLQAFLPGRVFSSLDLLTNVIGAIAGALLGSVLGPQTDWGRQLLALRRGWLRPGRTTDLALCAVATWALSQLSPFVPSLDLGGLRHGMRPLWNTLREPALFEIQPAAVYCLAALGLGLFMGLLWRPEKPGRLVFAVFLLAVLLLKVPVVTRQLSLEALGGAALGLGLAGPIQRRAPHRAALAAAMALAGAFFLEGLRADSPSAVQRALQPMNWIPFRHHSTSFFPALADVASGAWPFLALAALARLSVDRAAAGILGVAGGIGAALGSVGIEAIQRTQPGRTADVTDAIVAVGAWTLAWWLTGERR